MCEKDIKVEPDINRYSNETKINKIEDHMGRDLTQSPWINCWTSSLSPTAQYKSESLGVADLFKMETETAACRSLEADIKQECELYADHEIKRELVIGSTVVQCPCPEVLQLVCAGSVTDVRHDHTYSRNPVYPASDSGVREKSADSGATQHAATAWSRSEDEISSDIESASHTCYFGDEQLAKLIQTHTKERSYKCKICNNMFIWRDHLQRHTWTHAEKKPYSCDMCSKQFIHKGSLLYHIATHPGERSYERDVCSKKNIRKNDWKSQMLTNTIGKPYKCDVCGKEYAWKGNLNSHMRTHTGKKTCKCVVCGKVFTQKDYLILYIGRYTGEKPFKCDVCSKVFARKGYLNKHMRTHRRNAFYMWLNWQSVSSEGYLEFTHADTHVSKPFECDVCGKLFS